MIKKLPTSGDRGIEHIIYKIANVLNIPLIGNVTSLQGKPFYTKEGNSVTVTKQGNNRKQNVIRKSDGIIFIGNAYPNQFIDYLNEDRLDPLNINAKSKPLLFVSIQEIMGTLPPSTDNNYGDNPIAMIIYNWLSHQKSIKPYVTGIEDLKAEETRILARILIPAILRYNKLHGCYSCKHNIAPEAAHNFDGGELPLTKCDSVHSLSYRKLKHFEDKCIYFKRK